MRVFKDDRARPGYEFAENGHSRNALAVFNVLQPELARAPKDTNPFELIAFPFFAACAYYAEATDDGAARDFEGGIRIAVWAHSIGAGCTDGEAKAITEEVFTTMARISLLKAQGEDTIEALAEEPSDQMLEWISGALLKAEGAVKALALRG
ncbi:MAG: hypothetical protein U0167_14275 [bacterium]